MNFQQWLIEQNVEREKSPRTVAAYLADVALYEKWFAKEYREVLSPAKLHVHDLKRYRDELALTMKPASIQRRLAAVQAYLRFGWATGQVDEAVNPFANLRRPRQVRGAVRSLSTRDWNGLLKAATNDSPLLSDYEHRLNVRDYACILLMGRAGLRVAELCALTLGDVQTDPERGLVVVRHGKGNKHREVPLNADVAEAVRAWIQVRSHGGGDYLFTGKGSEHLTPRSVQRSLKQLGQSAGVIVSPHMLRHTFANHLAQVKRVSLDTVMVLMGHEDIRSTIRYTRPTADQLREAVA